MLEGMRVVSFCHYLQGPAATQYLADQGADVIKVEPIGGAYERRWSGANTFVEDVSAFYLVGNRNKRSISLDLKHPDGLQAALRLIDTADVVVENFRPGVMDKLGLGYEVLSGRKPELIYASATGFGSDGPMRDRPGQDMLLQARSGLVAATGEYGVRPTAVGCAVVDQHGASLLAMGILAAYVRRLKEGRGGRVEGSLLNAAIDLQTEPLTFYYSGRRNRDVFRRDHHLATWFHEAPYGIYAAEDGFIALSLNDLELLGAALESPAVAGFKGKDPYAHRDAIAPLIAAAVAGFNRTELEARLAERKLWYERVQDYDDLLQDPQVRHNRIFREIPIRHSTATVVNHPLRYDGEGPAEIRHLALEAGADTQVLLKELGYNDAEIAGMLDAGAAAASNVGAPV